VVNLDSLKEWRAQIARFSNLENILILIVPRAVGLLANVASSILIVRGLSVEDVGAYTLVVGYYMLMLVLSDLGINQTVLRYASKVATLEQEHTLVH
jgi:O-antigen/teichoic acid export membrane protein